MNAATEQHLNVRSVARLEWLLHYAAESAMTKTVGDNTITKEHLICQVAKELVLRLALAKVKTFDLK